ncbi:hypothetical protein N7G274_003332 [Stereocaulon virgatum]|uniref:Uncharacterized protein n=1 Tax=Stereocaulon virgatum TaxID=373712 RepID=A0ABR4ADB8_9LECA
MFGKFSKSAPAFLSWPETNAKDEDMQNDGVDEQSVEENIGDKHIEDERKSLDELPGLRRSTSGTTDLLTSVQEAGSDEHLVRAGPRDTVRLVTATGEPSSTTLSTTRPHQPGPETDTAVDYGWGASSLQDHETATNAVSISGATHNARVSAASQTDQSTISTSSSGDDEDHNFVRAPSQTSQLTHTGLLALANDFNRMSILSTFDHEEDGATVAASSMQGASNHKFGGLEPSMIARTEGK